MNKKKNIIKYKNKERNRMQEEIFSGLDALIGVKNPTSVFRVS